MSLTKNKEFNKAVYDFEIWEKAIQRKNASKDKNIIEKRTKYIVEEYNEIIKLARPTFESNETILKTALKNRIIDIRDRLIHCLGILHKHVDVPKDLKEEIDLSKITDITIIIDNDNMADQFAYLNNISKIINYKYAGDPNALSGFVTAIELANSITEEDKQETLVKYIKSKLEGKALEAIPENIENATQLIESLKEKIKPDTSKVVLGRFLALRAEKNSMQTFQKTAEELSDALRRAFISEGMTKKLAEETTIDKTVEMCRLSAKSNLVKSILASTQFNSPKEVLAKLITESTTENNETQILHFRNGNNRGRQRGNWRFNRNDHFNNSNQNSNFRGRNTHSNYRGRGRGYYNNNRNNNGNNRGNSHNRSGRVYYAENYQSPPPGDNSESETVQIRQAE